MYIHLSAFIMSQFPCRYACTPQRTFIISSISLIPYCALWALSYTFVPFSLVLRYGLHWSVNSNYILLLPSFILRLLMKIVFTFSFHLNTYISNLAYHLLFSFFVFVWECQVRNFLFSDCISDVFAHRVFSLDLVDEGLDGLLIFFSVRWTPLGKNGIFELGCS